jgi:hypothetical protein
MDEIQRTMGVIHSLFGVCSHGRQGQDTAVTVSHIDLVGADPVKWALSKVAGAQLQTEGDRYEGRHWTKIN